VEDWQHIENWKKNRDEKSLSHLLENHIKMIYSIANNYYYLGLNKDELFVEGAMGLISAVDKFDIEKGKNFSTFVYYWIRHSIQDFIRKAMTLKRRLVFRSMENHDGSSFIEKIIRPVMSLDDANFLQEISDKNNLAENVETKMQNEEIKNSLENAISFLNTREKKIIKDRWLKDKKTNFRTLGLELGISPERVRQIEISAMKKMKNSISEDLLEDRGFISMEEIKMIFSIIWHMLNVYLENIKNFFRNIYLEISGYF